MQKLHASSSFSALANVPFRQLWIASLASGTAVAADQTAARWVLHHLSGSAFVISLLSTMAALPFLVFTLPAGFLADAVDRRPLLQVINVWQALVAGTLALLGFLAVLTPAALLGGSLALGVGFAFNSPVWTALLPDVVSERDLPSTATLGALQMNLSGIVGPALGGFLLSLSSPPVVFGLNGFGFLGSWRRCAIITRKARRNLGPKRVTCGARSRMRSFTCEPLLPSVLCSRATFYSHCLCRPYRRSCRSSLSKTFGSTLRCSDYSLPSMSTGSVLGSLVLHGWMRRYFSANRLTLAGSALLSAIYLWMAFTHHNPFCFLMAGVAGAAWTLSASELWLAAQRAIAPWARGRVNAAVIMLSQGAMAVGGIVWGAAAEWFGTRMSLLVIAVLFVASLIVARRWSLDLLDIPSAPSRLDRIQPRKRTG